MPQRFYFDLTNGQERIQDAEGVDASGPDEAIKEAHAALHEMRGNEEWPALRDGWQLTIRDEDGETLRTLSLQHDGREGHDDTTDPLGVKCRLS